MPNEIERELMKCEAALYEMQRQYPAIARAAADARYVYDQAWADATIEVDEKPILEGQKKPTIPVMDAMTTKIVAKEMKAARDNESDLDAAKKHIDTLQAILSSIQTRSKLLLAEMSLK